MRGESRESDDSSGSAGREYGVWPRLHVYVPALRDLESALLSRKICHGNHPVLTMCAANAVVTTDPAGNRKLDKKRARGRIDGMVALDMALAVAATEDLQPPPDYTLYIV
jgi:phage terminase large subunit-like protein